MQVKVPSQEKMFGEKPESDAEEGESPDTKIPEPDEPVNAEQKMKITLNLKRQEVISTLIDRLGAKNKDFENCLNAQTILTELIDSKKIYKRIIASHNLQKLINHACDLKNLNQAFALNVLASILKEFSNFEGKKDSEVLDEFKSLMQKSFLDVTYSCLMLLRGSDNQIGEEPAEARENQAGVVYKRFGAKRMRALELLKAIIVTLSGGGEVSLNMFISKILKTQIISTLLQVIEDYEFSNVAN